MPQDIENEIKERLERIKIGDAKRYLLSDVTLLLKNRSEDLVAIENYIKPIEQELDCVKDLIKKVKEKFFVHITDQNKFSAAYLLLGKIFNNLKTVLVLARHGKSLEIVEIGRSAFESRHLIILFLDEENKKDLERWFKGEVVKNELGRNYLHEKVNKDLKDDDKLPVVDLLGDMYNIYSKYAHSTYGAILDSVDVFQEDFDFDCNAGFHYTRTNLGVIKDIISNLVLLLKNVFLEGKDLELFKEADKIYKRIEPQRPSEEDVKKVFEKLKKNDKKI